MLKSFIGPFVATFFIKSISQLQNIDLISKNIYSITLKTNNYDTTTR